MAKKFKVKIGVREYNRCIIIASKVVCSICSKSCDWFSLLSLKAADTCFAVLILSGIERTYTFGVITNEYMFPYLNIYNSYIRTDSSAKKISAKIASVVHVLICMH